MLPSLTSVGVSPPPSHFLLCDGSTTGCFPLSCCGGGREEGREGYRGECTGSPFGTEVESFRGVERAVVVVFFFGVGLERVPLDDLVPPWTDSSKPKK